MGWFTMIGASLLRPNFRLLSVDMQPKCAEIVQCGLDLNRFKWPPNQGITVLNRYVSSRDRGTIEVPKLACDTMASPTAVGGRRPDGTLRGTQARLNRTVLVPVPALVLGRHLLERSRSGDRVAVTKIDVEGFETSVLESLRPAWHMLDDVILELQPRAWRHHGVSDEAGITTLRELVAHNQYRVVSLPHTKLGKGESPKTFQVGPQLVDPCKLPVSNTSLESFRPPDAGLTRALVFDAARLEAAVRRLLRSSSHFEEFLLTRKRDC